MTHPYQVYDVFTDTPLAGNPLAVVFGADDIPTEAMHAIAREFNLSETVFITRPPDEEHAASVRIFTPARELPFAGHPTVGSAIALAHREGGASRTVKMALKAGPVTSAVTIDDGVGTAEFDAPIVPFVTGTTPDPDKVAQALGLTPSDIGFEGLTPSSANSGPHFMVVPVASVEALSKIERRTSLWVDTFGPGMCDIYCVTRTGADTFRARMFAPFEGIDEDPATGSAAVAFAAILGPHAQREGLSEYTISQGIEMGRPSRVSLTIDMASDTLKSVRLKGSAVRVAEGTLCV
ncbi:MAG: PhzF family phenazine biosynthesis protein [Pseudomonadota bacterium]